MPIDYSKWDKLELSDDEDIECHPNVDKASLIRWKQQDIHAKREERRQKIAALKQQISLNDVLLSRIDDMVVKLKKEGVQPFTNAIEQFREANKELLKEGLKDKERKGDSEGEGEGEGSGKPPTVDQMMAALFETVQKEVKDEDPELESISDSLIEKLTAHRNKLNQTQKEAKKELDHEERESKKKITVDDLHTGFDKTVSSYI